MSSSSTDHETTGWTDSADSFLSIMDTANHSTELLERVTKVDKEIAVDVSLENGTESTAGKNSLPSHIKTSPDHGAQGTQTHNTYYGSTTLHDHAQAVVGDVNNSYHYHLPTGSAVPLLVDNNASAALVAQLRQLVAQYEPGHNHDLDVAQAISTKVEAWLSSAASRYERSEYGSIMIYDSVDSRAIIQDLRKKLDVLEAEKAELERSFNEAESSKVELAAKVWDLTTRLKGFPRLSEEIQAEVTLSERSSPLLSDIPSNDPLVARSSMKPRSGKTKFIQAARRTAREPRFRSSENVDDRDEYARQHLPQGFYTDNCNEVLLNDTQSLDTSPKLPDLDLGRKRSLVRPARIVMSTDDPNYHYRRHAQYMGSLDSSYDEGPIY